MPGKNIAASLAQAGHATLLVDLDEQANASKGLGVDPADLALTLNDLFANPELDPASAVLTTEVDGLHLIAGHPNLARTETGLALQRTDPTAPDPIGALKPFWPRSTIAMPSSSSTRRRA